MVKVTFYPLYLPDDNDLRPFTRTFPDMETWLRVQACLTGTYSRIDVEEMIRDDTRTLSL